MKIENTIFLNLIIVIQTCFVSCDRSDIQMPIVQIDSINNISHNSAIIYAQIIDDGGSTPTYGGLAWSDKPGVTLDDTISRGGDGYMNFTCALTELEPAKTYYVRSYCEDSRGGVLGNEMSFTTKTVETFTDSRDGNIYPVLPMGNLIWMGENLRFTTTKGSVSVENSKFSDLTKFGRLYAFEVAQNVCPVGWRLPSDDDWKDLEKYIGVPEAELNIFNRTSNVGNQLKHPGNKYFLYTINDGSNITGFTALPAGIYNENSYYSGFGNSTVFWTSSFDNEKIWVRYLQGNGGVIERFSDYKNSNSYFAIRCVKDKP